MFLTKAKTDQLKQAIQENIPSGGHKFTGEMDLLLYNDHVNIMNKTLCRPMSNSLLLIVFYFLMQLSFQIYYLLKRYLALLSYRILTSKWQEMHIKL